MDKPHAFGGASEIGKAPDSDGSVPLSGNSEGLPKTTSAQHEEIRCVSDEKSGTSVPTGSLDVPTEAHLPGKPTSVSDALVADGSRKRSMEEAAIDGGTLQDRDARTVVPIPPNASTSAPITSHSTSDLPAEVPAKKPRVEDNSNLALLLEASVYADPISTKSEGDCPPSSQSLPASAELATANGPGGRDSWSPPISASTDVFEPELPSSGGVREETAVVFGVPPSSQVKPEPSSEPSLPHEPGPTVESTKIGLHPETTSPEAPTTAEAESTKAGSGLHPETPTPEVESANAGDGPQPETAASEVDTPTSIPQVEPPNVGDELQPETTVSKVESANTGAEVQRETPTPQVESANVGAGPTSNVVATTVEATLGLNQQISMVPSPTKGGIFDDADSDGEATKRLSQTPETPIAAANPKGGIFDDADDDESFDLPSYEHPTATIAETKSRILIEPSPISKVDTTWTPKPSVLPPPTAPVAPADKNDQGKTVDKTGEDKKDSPKKKKKKPTKPTKRVLVARKEKDAAALVMKGKDDLVGILDMEHCQFLGKEFWIFTVQQLECILKSIESVSDAATDPAEPSVPPQKSRECQLRQALVEKVAKSHFVASDKISVSEGSKEQTELKNETGSNIAASLIITKPESGEAGEAATKEASESPGENGALSADKPKNDAIHFESATVNGNSSEAEHRPNGHSEVLKGETGEPAAAKEIPSTVSDREARREAAETILQSWQSKVDSWRASDKSQNIPMEKKFLLSGPISCLFPTFSQRFFASVPMLSLYDFLCLKKTETGGIIALCGAWRKKCGLAHASPLALAKHFLGLGLRAETAIASAVPPDATSRKWLGDPIVVLTGAAKEFAIEELGIYSGTVFIETRTKDLANQLVEWRTKKGLPPLKGSGKVAMISGWKANVKEAIDLEQGKGKVLVGVNLQALVEQAEDAPIVKEEKKKAPQSAKPVPQQEFTFDPRIPDVEVALHSTKFLQEVLESKHFAALQEAGIKTAEELFSAQKNQGSPLALAVSKILPDPSTFELVIFDWCQIVRKKLSGIRRVHSKRKDPPPGQSTDSEPKAKKDKPSEPRNVAPRPNKNELLEKDVFYSLSTVTQTFLGSLGIKTAEAFMTSRTTDLSSAFVEWRAKHEMSVLKGLGAIASVSGWKAQVRKIARDRGLHDLALMAPGGPTGVAAPSPSRKPKPVATKPKVNAVSSLENKLVGVSKTRITRPDVLFGKSTHRVVVESTRGMYGETLLCRCRRL